MRHVLVLVLMACRSAPAAVGSEIAYEQPPAFEQPAPALPSAPATPLVGAAASTTEPIAAFVVGWSSLDGEYYVDGPCSCDRDPGRGVEMLWSVAIDPMLTRWMPSHPR